MEKKPSCGAVGPLILALIFAVIGLGLLAGAIVQALPLTRARIELERHPASGVTGSLSFVLSGVPIFWRSLDGLDHLENQDFKRNHMQRYRYRGKKTIYRLGFVNARGETLAWTERPPVMNQADFITSFLDGGRDKLLFLQEAAFQTTFREIRRGVLGAALAMTGSLLIWLGVKNIYLFLFRRAAGNKPAES